MSVLLQSQLERAYRAGVVMGDLKGGLVEKELANGRSKFAAGVL